MKKASGSTKHSTQAQATESTKKSTTGQAVARQSQAARVDGDYSPPCTRSQTERFVLQLKVQAEEEDRRASIMSQRSHDRSVLKSMQNLGLSEVKEEDRKAGSEKDGTGKKGTPAPSKVTKATPKKGAGPASAADDKKESCFKLPKSKAAPKKGK
ncbi:hypothetical protein HPB52_021685 [Rhipicephalus sanguineus]|uniref:Uncharacterized protein n=1 Tax=Rhipicephalus sanguineus TaxID=34632 RepID=A0A9D4QAM1_RHISA|nr:hypothetical protein HPB52_021685 [Rhipicephalus sanguineus]